MGITLPTILKYGEVTGRFMLAVADSPAQGTVEFTPDVQYVVLAGETVYLRPVVCTLDAEGYLTDAEGNRSVHLLATDNEGSVPPEWSYTVNLNITGVPKRTFHIVVPADTTLALSGATHHRS